MKRRRRIIFGPGLIVTAAFIGPGTVTTATRAGAAAGSTLLWAVLFSVLCAIVLQEMAARLGIVTRLSLSRAAMEIGMGSAEVARRGPRRLQRVVIGGLILAAIGYGNAAYQSGNLTGAAAGIETLIDRSVFERFGGDEQASRRVLSTSLLGVMTLLSGAILWGGSYKWFERILISLVVVMSLVFCIAAVLARPDLGSVIRGTCIPSIPKGQFSLVLALIGTTVVPYNLFLHAQSVQERWASSDASSLSEARWDTVLSIALGGAVTGAILVTSSSAFFNASDTSTASIGEMADQLKPAVGSFAKYMFAIGLFAAGLTSSITAPWAAAYATFGVFHWERCDHPRRFVAVAISVLLVGAGVALWGQHRPTEVILAAQIANALLLPVIAVLLWAVVNEKHLMGDQRNRWFANLLAGTVVISSASWTLYRLYLSLVSWWQSS